MARVLAVFDDLLLGSNVLGMLRAAGHDATLTTPARAHPDGADVVIVDLGADGGLPFVERIRAAGELGDAKLLGVHSHVDVGQRERGLAAGLDLVVPRSRMAREGAVLIDRVLSPG